jgi:hypothetical protein
MEFPPEDCIRSAEKRNNPKTNTEFLLETITQVKFEFMVIITNTIQD